MKRILLLVFTLVLINCSSQVTILKNDPGFITEDISGGAPVVIAPISGKWEIAGYDSTYYRFPEADIYTDILIEQLEENRPCMKIIHPKVTSKYCPNLEFELIKRKYSFHKMTEDDSLFFKHISSKTGGKYLILFESIMYGGSNYYTVSSGYSFNSLSMESSTIIQVWDLTITKLVYRAKIAGFGESIIGLLKGTASRDAVKNSIKPIFEKFPVCN